MKKALNAIQNYVLLSGILVVVYYFTIYCVTVNNEKGSENLLSKFNNYDIVGQCQSYLQKCSTVEMNASISLGNIFFLAVISFIGFILFRMVRNKLEDDRIERNKYKILTPKKLHAVFEKICKSIESINEDERELSKFWADETMKKIDAGELKTLADIENDLTILDKRIKERAKVQKNKRSE